MGHPIAWESNQKEQQEILRRTVLIVTPSIKVAKPREGVVITCPRCGVELEIISSDPFEVGFTEDWQDEGEDE